MQIVIDIDDKLYEIIKNPKKLETMYHAGRLCEAVRNGTPLPKGHGKLIAEPTEKDIAKTIGGQNDFAECIRDSVKAVFDNADAIIEADKGESEDKDSKENKENDKDLWERMTDDYMK